MKNALRFAKCLAKIHSRNLLKLLRRLYLKAFLPKKAHGKSSLPSAGSRKKVNLLTFKNVLNPQLLISMKGARANSTLKRSKKKFAEVQFAASLEVPLPEPHPFQTFTF